jgi:hypothetical protein
MKNEIYYNDLRPSRFRVMPLGLAEQEEVIEAINYLLENDNGNINKKWLGLIQRFVDNYAKLEHHRAITEGLYSFDSDPRHLLEEFWQRSSDACPLTCTEAENEETAFAEWVKNKIITISY